MGQTQREPSQEVPGVCRTTEPRRVRTQKKPRKRAALLSACPYEFAQLYQLRLVAGWLSDADHAFERFASCIEEVSRISNHHKYVIICCRSSPSGCLPIEYCTCDGFCLGTRQDGFPSALFSSHFPRPRGCVWYISCWMFTTEHACLICDLMILGSQRS